MNVMKMIKFFNLRIYITLIFSIFFLAMSAKAENSSEKKIIDTTSLKSCTTITPFVGGDDNKTYYALYAYGFKMLDDSFKDKNLCPEDAQSCPNSVYSSCNPDDEKITFLMNGVKYSLAKNESMTTTKPQGRLKAIENDNKICVVAYLIGQRHELGCKLKYEPSTIIDKNSFEYSKCNSGARLCAAKGVEGSMYEGAHFTAKIIQCIKANIDQLFARGECLNSNDLIVTNFARFQYSMREIVTGLLVIYVILFGFKIVISDNVPDKASVIMFLIKFVLVLYFSVGIVPKNNNQGAPEYNDGVTNFIRPVFDILTTGLSNMIINKSGNPNFCQFSEKEYNEGFGYLALWDSIDCRVTNYLNFKNFNIVGILVSFILNLQLIEFVLLSIILLFLFSVFMYVANVFVLALIGVALLMFFAPIFIPLALFDRTKSYFSNWLKLLFSYTLQPVIIVMFVALLMTMLDNFIFGDLNIILDNTGNIEKVELTDDSGQEKLWGFKMYNSVFDLYSQTAIFTRIYIYPAIGLFASIDLLIEMALILVLSLMFVEAIGQFAADLTEGNNLSENTISPTAFFMAAKDLLVKAAKGIKEASNGADNKNSGTSVTEKKDESESKDEKK